MAYLINWFNKRDVEEWTMSIKKRGQKLPLLVLLTTVFLFGSPSFAQDKKNPNPFHVSPELIPSEEENLSLESGGQIATTSTQGDQASVFNFLTPPPFKFQEGINTRI
jgi:hypothetical protein